MTDRHGAYGVAYLRNLPARQLPTGHDDPTDVMAFARRDADDYSDVDWLYLDPHGDHQRQEAS